MRFYVHHSIISITSLLQTGSLLVIFSILLAINGADAHAAPRSLPVGQLVSYSGAICGQINGTWLPGNIDARGRFETSSSSLTALKKRAKRATGRQKKALQAQVTKLQRQITARTTTCSQLGTGIIAPTGAQSASGGATTITWVSDFSTLDLSDTPVGAELPFFCPAGGNVDTIWGSDTYTADSSICNAAVHAGVINRSNGGNVRVRVKAGQSYYVGGIRNGVEALMYTSYPKSYSFINPSTNLEVASAAPVIIDWDTRITTFRSISGTPFTFLCAANGSRGSLWGTDTYTDDSTVCTAALHAGKISSPRGGQITVRTTAGLPSYVGSTRRKVTSNSYGAWSGSIAFD